MSVSWPVTGTFELLRPMPDLAPGVYVEEVSFRAKSIEGVSTSTAGFIGPTRYGPIDAHPEIITSLCEFERTYGDGRQLQFGARKMHNWMWHAVRVFFEQGGKRLYGARVFEPNDGDSGIAKVVIGSRDTAITIHARYPGQSGNMRVRLTLRAGSNVSGLENSGFHGLQPYDVVFVSHLTNAPGKGSFYVAERDNTTK